MGEVRKGPVRYTCAVEAIDQRQPAPGLAIAGWAIFLACSWTWCIGMYLPVLLVRDLGVWAWVIFAVPNIVGAAAMGWVLREPGASQRMVDGHRSACLWFSIVTIAFHVFFVGWMVQRLLSGWGIGLFAAAVALVYALRRDLAVGVIVLTGSLMAMAFLLGRGELFAQVTPLRHGPRLLGDLGGLAAVACLGFLLCPYLDLTFHRARQSTDPRAGAVAFAAGFVGPFLLMILFTLAYAALLEYGGSTVALRLLGLHMAVQSGFTVAVHLRSVRQQSRGVWPWGALLVAAIIAIALAAGGSRPADLPGVRGGEGVYRCFMVFYGLAFPTYVWLFMAGRRTGGRAAGPLLVSAIAFALPFYAMGFLFGPMVWILPGVGVVLAAGLLGSVLTSRERERAVDAP